MTMFMTINDFSHPYACRSTPHQDPISITPGHWYWSSELCARTCVYRDDFEPPRGDTSTHVYIVLCSTTAPQRDPVSRASRGETETILTRRERISVV